MSFQNEEALPLTTDAEAPASDTKPASFMGKVLTALVLSVSLVSLALASQFPSSANAATGAIGSMSMDNLEPSPHAKGEPIVKGPLYCPKLFKKGDTRFVPESCTLFSQNDLNWAHMVDSNVLYVCGSKALSPINIKEGTFEHYGIPIDVKSGKGISLIHTGEFTKLAIYEDKFDGRKDQVNEMNDHSLISNSYNGEEIENDAVKSAMMYSEDPLMPISCDDLFDYIEKKQKHGKH
jgi:hypothetical protein